MSSQQIKKIPVIVDTDPGVDDTLALLLALSSPELDVLAIVVTYGNSDVGSSYTNVFKIYQALSKHLDAHPDERKNWPNFAPERKTILAIGAKKPLEGEIHNAQYFHGRDGLGGISERHPEFNLNPTYGPTSVHPQLQLTEKSGAEVALELIRSEPSRSITYIALGPLTTLAQIVNLDQATIRERIGSIMIMGGALDVPGNTSPVAEFNFFADPVAVHKLLNPPEGSLPLLPLDRLVVIPLDITTTHELPFLTYQSQVDPSLAHPAQPNSSEADASKKKASPLVQFTSSIFENTREIMVRFGKDAMELHDIVVVWSAISNPPKPESSSLSLELKAGWGLLKRRFEIERTGELTRGMLVIDRRDDKGAYAPGANRAKVQAELEKYHFQSNGLVLESTAVPAQVVVENESQAHPPKTNVGSAGQINNGSGPNEQSEKGVFVVTSTPGPQQLLGLLLQRVWGVAF